MTDLHEKAEKLASTLERINDVCDAEAATLLRDLSARLAEVEADLKSVLDREAATTARYDARLAEVERERDARAAAAYEEAALALSAWLNEYPWHSTLASDIRALARPEETDALDRLLQKAREEERALQELSDLGQKFDAAIREDKT